MLKTNGSQTVKLDLRMFAEEIEETPNVDISEIMKEFGIYKSEESNDDEHDEEETEEIDDEFEEPPAKEEPKKITVKFNKEDVEVDVSDEKLPEYVQKALALDKERERKTEYEKALDRAAKLAGYKDHTDFISNLDELEQLSQQRQQTEYEQLQQQLLDDLEANGIDRDQAKQYLESNPLLQQAKLAIEEKERLSQERKQVEQQQNHSARWNQLFQKYPNLVESAGEELPAWYTPEMSRRIESGYDPVDAYDLAHRDKLVEQTKKQTEQAAIKKQMLNKRSQIADQGIPDTEPEVPRELSSAFSLFGLSPKAAQKYAKK